MTELKIDPKFKRGYCLNLLSWKELTNVINITPLMSLSRVKSLSNKKYSWFNNNNWSTDNNCYPSSVLEQIIEDSGVCYFNDMSRSTEKINKFAKNLEDEYDQYVDAHIYMCRNLKPVHPFGIHFDLSHNVIVQCEGQSNFKVWDRVSNPGLLYYNNKSVKMEIDKEPILDVDMNPGDTIWIPKYYPHLATSYTKRLSVSFPFNKKIESLRREDRHWINYD